jgi:lipid II:glycine glycyltransferase (peptidoglycan interpeptide bridge formation enzyme)
LSGKFYWHTTALSLDPEAVFRRFKQSQVQRNIRRAEKEGVTVHVGTTWENMQLFYGLHINTRRRQGVPVQPIGYFRSLWKNLVSEGLGFIALAYHHKQLLAAAVFLHWKKTITYKYGASDSRFWGLRPNNLIMWQAIRWGCENGYQVFDWGRTDLEDEGLRDFKLGWGSEEKMLQYTILADRPPHPAGQGRLRKAMKIVIQHSPTWVCRVMGELFYRFAA